MIQCFIYNQCDRRLINPGTRYGYFLISSTPPSSPIGRLSFHPLSLVYEYYCAKQRCHDVGKTGIITDLLRYPRYHDAIGEVCRRHPHEPIVVMEPIEPYLARRFERIVNEYRAQGFTISLQAYDPFLVSHDDFCGHFGLDKTTQPQAKPPIMETFYRWMRKRGNWLMDDQGKPRWWQRNFDKENRKWKAWLAPLVRPRRDHPRKDEAERVLGVSGDCSLFPISPQQAYELLERFCDHALQGFGTWEDAMYSDNPLVHHSLLSLPLNVWLLDPSSILAKVCDAGYDHIPLNDREWFLRQILGWREYMRQWFLCYQDSIYEVNVLQHTHHAPQYRRWSQEWSSWLHCLDTVTQAVEKTWYVHHIQRLMIVGNIWLLLNIHPHDILKRFWEQFVDAYERVVVPNVLGMSQFADGGNLATKPYVAWSNYIASMSDYCRSCRFDPKAKDWDRACPLTTLYWDFVNTQQAIYRKGRQPYLLNHLSKLDIPTLHHLADHYRRLYTAASA